MDARGDLPFSTQTMFLKQVDLFGITGHARAIISLLFPYYEELAEARTKQSLDRSIAGVEELLYPGAMDDPNVEIMTNERPTRRFAGDGVPRNMYYTVAKNASGNDDGTLENELLSYYRPDRTKVVCLWDCTVPGRSEFLFDKTGLSFERCLVIGFPPGNDEVLKELKLTDAMHHTALGYLCSIDVNIVSLTSDEIIDLRIPETTQWFVEDFAGKSFHLFKKPLNHFHELLPSILSQDPGGSTITHSIGIQLRDWGVGGLVFPSARSDPFVRLKEGRVEAWSGWNYVDYRTTPPSGVSLVIDDKSEWASKIGFLHPWIDGSTFATNIYDDCSIEHTDEGIERGSWRVIGLRDKNRALKELLILNSILEYWTPQLDPKFIRQFMSGMGDIFRASGRDAYQAAIGFNNMLTSPSRNPHKEPHEALHIMRFIRFGLCRLP